MTFPIAAMEDRLKEGEGGRAVARVGTVAAASVALPVVLAFALALALVESVEILTKWRFRLGRCSLTAAGLALLVAEDVAEAHGVVALGRFGKSKPSNCNL